MNLHPTKTRLELLTLVSDLQVAQDVVGDSYIIGDRKVTTRIAELSAAGWVARAKLGTRWHLTRTGREVLEASR